MTEFKYCVYCEDGPAICFESEAEAMKFAREDTSMYSNVKVEKSEVDEDGDILNTKVLWTASGKDESKEKEVVSDNEFETDFPESDLNTFNIPDDENYGEQAWESLDVSIKEAVDALEENEDEVECKVCFELGPKAEMKKLDIGYVCPKCAQELQSHQGTNLDLIDKDPFSLDYEDPRDFDEPEEVEVKEEPVDENEIRKHEAGIEETLEEHINDRPADIESEQEYQGVDNAVVDCPVATIIAHSEDEKPLDCEMKKPALEEPLAGEEVDVKVNEDLSEEETKELDKEIETLKEELKVIVDFSDYKPWSGAVDTYDLIKDADKLDDLEAYLEECYPDGITATQINDILWFDSDQVLSYLGLGDVEDEEVDESLQEAKKDDELPVDPEAAKLEVHTMLNDLVADEIEAINGYEEAKKEILDAPISHKDTILDTVDHIEDEEKEHVDELISATTEIPFDKEESPAPVVEEPAVEEPVEEEPLDQEFPEVEEKLEEKVDLPAFDSDVKVGDKIRIIHLEGEDASYDGKEGTVDHIDSIGQLHGTWGGLAVIPGVDSFEVITEESLEEAKAPKYKVVVSWEGTFCGEKRVYKNDRFYTYEFDHEPTKQEVEDRFYNDPNIVRLKNWKINNVRKEVKDFMDGAYDNDDGWKDIEITDYKIIKESLKEEKAKPEADKEKTYNDGLKLAKLHNKPVIYGYTNKSYGGKFFALDDPIVCNSVSDETKKFKAQYKSCGTVYVAYPDKDFVESLKLSEGLDLEDDKPEIFTPEEQEEYNCDEDGNCLDSYDRLHHCGWCGDVFTEYEMRHEADFGWLCDRCIDELKSHGGPLTFIEEAVEKKDPKEAADKVDDIMNSWGFDDEPKEKPADEQPKEIQSQEQKPAEPENGTSDDVDNVMKDW